MLLSLVTGGISVLNASAFLLMASGPALLEYIVCSSIFAVAASLYTWLLPAAIAYDAARLPVLRLMQVLTVAVASALMLATHSSIIGMTFVAMMLIEAAVFPAYMLLFRSKTNLYIRTELARGLANSLTLLLVLFVLDRDPQVHVLLLLGNFVAAALLLALFDIHRPPSLRLAQLSALLAMRGRQFWSRQLVALLLARGIEMGSLIALGRMGALAPALSLKIGMSISSALAVNARVRPTWQLVGAHLAVYAGVMGAILGIQQIPGLPLPLPDTFLLIEPRSALMMLPVALLAFLLAIAGLRSAAMPAKVGD